MGIMNNRLFRSSLRLLQLLLLLIGAAMLLPSDSDAQESIGLGGFIVSPPLAYVKQHFITAEHDRPVIHLVNSASTSIAVFANSVYDHLPNALLSNIKRVLPGSQQRLRLPPSNKFDSNRRYIYMAFYCWQAVGVDRLQFLIEWADLQTKDRYTDSYIFVKSRSEWYFESHGQIAPWRSPPMKPNQLRQCPPT